MKFRYLATILSFTWAGWIAGINHAKAQNTQFVCGAWRDIPMTVAQTPNRNVPVIYWVSDWVNDPSSDLTPQSRCEIVSDNFQQAYDRGELQYITTGIKNGQNIVCVAQQQNGSCVSQLFTLKPGSDPNKSLRQLMNIGESYAAGNEGPLYQSSGKRIYIDFEDFLNKAAESASEDSPN